MYSYLLHVRAVLENSHKIAFGKFKHVVFNKVVLSIITFRLFDKYNETTSKYTTSTCIKY